MDKKLVKFIESTYEMALLCNNKVDVRCYMHQSLGACCYEYERSGDLDAINCG